VRNNLCRNVHDCLSSLHARINSGREDIYRGPGQYVQKQRRPVARSAGICCTWLPRGVRGELPIPDLRQLDVVKLEGVYDHTGLGELHISVALSRQRIQSALRGLGIHGHLPNHFDHGELAALTCRELEHFCFQCLLP